MKAMAMRAASLGIAFFVRFVWAMVHVFNAGAGLGPGSWSGGLSLHAQLVFNDLPAAFRASGYLPVVRIEKPGEPYGKLAAGALLEKVGAKDMRIGGAKVSEKHANILLNSGQASAADIKRLADILKAKVKTEFGYILEEEITFLGDY